MTHYVIVPRGTQGTGRDSALARFTAQVAQRSGKVVHLGYMDGGLPSLREALDAADEQGATTIVLLPLAVPRDMNLTSWTRRVASEWAAAAPDRPEVRLGSIDDDDLSAQLLADALDASSVQITPTAGAISDPSWSEIPDVDHHVLICRGPRCSARGSAANYRRLLADLTERGIPAERVLVTRTPCLSPCNRGPLLVVYPDNTWYEAVDEDKVSAIVADHLGG